MPQYINLVRYGILVAAVKLYENEMGVMANRWGGHPASTH
jgi:hypothetical protein